jgi:diaminopimelate epimerase
MPEVDSSLRLFKYHALGNSFLILDPRRAGPALAPFRSAESNVPSAHLVRMLCDVTVGVGSNGLLFGPLFSSTKQRFGLSIINSDGTSAGFSGNGARIFAQYLMDSGDAYFGQVIGIEISQENNEGGLTSNIAPVRLPVDASQPISVTAPHMPRFGAKAVAASAALIPASSNNWKKQVCYCLPALAKLGSDITRSPTAWTASVPVEIGNPHFVTFVSAADELPDLEALRSHHPALKAIAFCNGSNAQIFASGINLQWAWPESRTALKLAVYERGEGPTMASGSSACAAACAAYALGLVDSEVEVRMPGGNLGISLRGTPDKITSVTLSGFASRIFEGTVDLTTLQP